MNEPKLSYRIRSAIFTAGSPDLSLLPISPVTEVAFIGRSNAGKSSLINRLTNHKGLARTSSMPGRTQEINLFSVSLLTPSSPIELTLVDLPGFGFAKFSKQQRQQTSKLIVQYITEREALSGICLLNDCRRLPGEDEQAVQKLAFKSDRRITIVLTKCDKLSKNELTKQHTAIAKAYHLEPSDIIRSGEKFSTDEVWGRLLRGLI